MPTKPTVSAWRLNLAVMYVENLTQENATKSVQKMLNKAEIIKIPAGRYVVMTPRIQEILSKYETETRRLNAEKAKKEKEQREEERKKKQQQEDDEEEAEKRATKKNNFLNARFQSAYAKETIAKGEEAKELEGVQRSARELAASEWKEKMERKARDEAIQRQVDEKAAGYRKTEQRRRDEQRAEDREAEERREKERRENDRHRNEDRYSDSGSDQEDVFATFSKMMEAIRNDVGGLEGRARFELDRMSQSGEILDIGNGV